VLHFECIVAHDLECSQLQGASVEWLCHAPVVAIGNLAAAVCKKDTAAAAGEQQQSKSDEELASGFPSSVCILQFNLEYMVTIWKGMRQLCVCLFLL
jgi:hypothetical protein